MIDKAWKALSGAPTVSGSQKQSRSALKHQTYLFVLVFLIFFCDTPAHRKTSFTSVKADQPVHCLRGQLYGVWNFHVSKQVDKINLFDVDEVCTHKLPNKLQILSKDHKFSFAQEDVWKVKLMDKFQVEAILCKDGTQCAQEHLTGTWSTIYDQSFKIELENGLRFLANFKYTIKPELSALPQVEGSDKFEAIKTGDYGKFDSQCDKTMVGFVQTIPTTSKEKYSMTQHKVVCFYAEQETHYEMEKTVSVKTESDTVKVAVITSQNKIATKPIEQSEVQTETTNKPVTNSSLAEIKKVDPKKANTRSNRTSKTRFNAHKEHQANEETDKAISFINSQNLGWKADVCKLSKGHQDYGSHCQAQEKAQNLAQLETQLDLDLDEGRKGFEFGKKGGQAFAQAYSSVQQWYHNFSSADEIPDHLIPESYDLRSIDGFDFTNPLRDQGACGSCYTVSFTQVVESRLKQRYGKKVPVLSPQYLMMCNYLNEGCDGGWSFFHGFLAENGYLVSEKCAPYKAKTKNDKCKNYEKCKPIAKVKQSYFIGGAYGESSEKKMMKEILRNGIVNGELNVPRIFSFYQKGILSNDHEAKMSSYLEYSGLAEHHKQVQQMIGIKNKKHLTDRDLEDYGIAWMNLNHSVVIVGWGVDEKTGTKYWIVRNSYGKRWGMNGDFLVRRGENDFGIESETTGYEIQLCDEQASTPGNCVPVEP